LTMTPGEAAYGMENGGAIVDPLIQKN